MAKVEIPLEIITEILTRLPVKPLSRFKCVSKPWNSLISSPSFITHHFKSNPNTNIVLTSHHHSLLSAASIPDTDTENNNNLHFTKLNHPLKLMPRRLDTDVYLIDVCNGILLISDHAKKAIVMYNPANNTYRLLPPYPNQTTVIRCDEFFGIGYDRHTDDYKVIRVIQTPGVCIESCLYSMKENVWKVIKDESVSVRKNFIQPCNSVAVHGVPYFVAISEGFKPVLMCFDFRTELFSIVEYPVLDSYEFKKLSISLKELGGCPCLFVNYKSKGMGGQLLYADVWEMREGSWVKLFRIRKSEVVGKGEGCTLLRFVAYSKDKRKVSLSVDSTWFGWYDLVSKRVKKVKTHGLPVEDLPRVAVTYVESLVSVSNDKAKAVSKVGSTSKNSKKTVKNKNMGDFLSKGFKLKL